MADRFQELLRCCFEIMSCREWGKHDHSWWPIQTELDWALEIQEIIKMYQITSESLQYLSETSQSLFSKLQTSPFWALVKDEPDIKNFMNALGAIESQMKQQQLPPAGEQPGVLYGEPKK